MSIESIHMYAYIYIHTYMIPAQNGSKYGPKFKIPKYAQNTAFKKCTSVVLGGLAIYIYIYTSIYIIEIGQRLIPTPLTAIEDLVLSQLKHQWEKKNYLTEKRPTIGLESILMLRLPLFISLVYHGMFTLNVH